MQESMQQSNQRNRLNQYTTVAWSDQVQTADTSTTQERAKESAILERSPARPSSRNGRRQASITAVATAITSIQALDGVAWDSVTTNPLADVMPRRHYDTATSKQSTPQKLPRYLTVEAVHENHESTAADQVVVEPVIHDIGPNDIDLQGGVQQKVNDLYDFFRKLYDQDQLEISALQAQLMAKDAELKRLRSIKQPGSAKGADIQQPPELPTQEQAAGHKPVNILFLPRQLNVGNPLYRASYTSLIKRSPKADSQPLYLASIYHSYNQQRTRWLSIIWLIIFLLALILLLAFLVPWHKHRNQQPGFSSGPTVLGVQPNGASIQVMLSRDVELYYAVLPSTVTADAAGQAAARRALLTTVQYYTSPYGSYSYIPYNTGQLPAGANERIGKVSPEDVIDVVEGKVGAFLQPVAMACGKRRIQANKAADISLFSVDPAMVECVNLAASGQPGRCSLCPVVAPSTNFTLLVVARGRYSSSEVAVTYFITPSGPGYSWSPAQTPLTSLPVLPSTSAPAFMLDPGARVQSDAAIDLVFKLDSPGTVHYMVTYDKLYAQFGSSYTVFNTSQPDLYALATAGNASSYTGGVVAVGHILVSRAGDLYTCRMGRDDGTSPCGCGADNPCVIPVPCSGAQCDVSEHALMARASYKLYLFTESTNKQYRGPPVALPSFSMADDASAPQLSGTTSVDPVVGPYSFKIGGISQDETGFAYVLITAPRNASPQVKAGTATSFVKASTSPISKRRLAAAGNALAHAHTRADSFGASNARDADWHSSRSLSSLSPTAETQQLPATTVLSALPMPPAAGLFTPACAAKLTCDPYQAIQQFVDSEVEDLVSASCVPIANLSSPGRVDITALGNDTMYTVRLITTDTNSNEQLYEAQVKTVDLTPPVFTAIDKSAGFTGCTISFVLNEPGQVFAYIAPFTAIAELVLEPSWPPSAKGPVVESQSETVKLPALAGQMIFLTGLQPNTDYMVFLLARDDNSNTQSLFTPVLVHTADNIPPAWLQRSVTGLGRTADVAVQLDEPSTVHYVLGLQQKMTECPEAQQMFNLELPENALAMGTFLFPSTGTPYTYQLVNLTDSTNYTLCMIAEDTTSYRNKQSDPVLLPLYSPDITPPQLAVGVIPGRDEDVTCNRDTTFLCDLSFAVTLSEPGTATYAVTLSDAAPPAASLNGTFLFTATAEQLSEVVPVLLGSGVVTAPVGRTAYVRTAAGLISNTTFAVLVAARDVAGNVNETVVRLNVTAPDRMPPTFLASNAQSLVDSSLTVSVRMDELSQIFYVIMPNNSAIPTPTDVLAGRGKASAAPAAAGSFSAPASNTQMTNHIVANLQAGGYYCLYMVAVDAMGNQQLTVRAICNLRIMDASKPVILMLATLYTPPKNAFTITVSSSKPGRFYYLAVKTSQPKPRAVQQLVQPTYGNFSGSAAIPSADTAVNIRLCVADGQDMELYGMVQDQEGLYNGGIPNNSTLLKAIAVMEPIALPETCPSAAPAAVLKFRAGLARSSPGFPMGPLRAVRASDGTVLGWMQQYGSLAHQPSGQWGEVMPSIHGVPVSQTLKFSVAGLLPGSVTMVLRTLSLYYEDNSSAGRTLSLAYQLLDRNGRTTVTLADIQVIPVVSLLKPMSGQSSSTQLPACTLDQVAESSGIGNCQAEVPAGLFPASGSSAANVSLAVYKGSLHLATSTSVQISLIGPPSRPAANTTTAGLVATLPYRRLHAGEALRVTVTAIQQDTRQPSIKGFTLPVSFDPTKVSFVRVEASALWADMVDFLVPGSGTTAVWVTSLTRLAADSMYRGPSVTLFDIHFIVKDALQAASEILSFGQDIRLLPFSTVNVDYNDYRSRTQPAVAGWIDVAPIQPRALLAYASHYDVFNTAVFTNEVVKSSIGAVVVNSWGSTEQSQLQEVAPDSCTTSLGNDAFDLDQCAVVIQPSHSSPAKDVSVKVSLKSGLSAVVKLRVWFPTDTALLVDDPVLNRVLPLNAGATPTGCTGRFQGTNVRVSTSWSNGGTSSPDTIRDVDITDVVQLKSDNPAALLVSGSTIKGLRAAEAADLHVVTYNPIIAASINVSISSEPVCIMGIEAVSLAGFDFAPLTPQPGIDDTFNVTMKLQQNLTWESATSFVRTVVSFSDDTTSDVTDEAEVAPRPISQSSSIPFTVTPDPLYNQPQLVVNASLGTPESCGAYLSSSWTVCSSIPMAMTQSLLQVALPRPTAIHALLVSPMSISIAGDGASQAPISIPTSGNISVWVRFSDGTIRDFSTDERTAVTVAAGVDLCRVLLSGPGALPKVESTPGAPAGGQCTIRATVSIPGFTPLSVTNTTTLVTLRPLNLYFKPASFLPPVTWSSTSDTAASPSMPVRMLKCDFRNYEARSLWVAGQLSNCSNSGSSNCTVVDLNNPMYTMLLTDNALVASLVVNPASPKLRNLVLPMKAGQAVLSAIFGSAFNTVPVSVEETFLPGWPQVVDMNDTSLAVVSDMAADFQISYLVVTSASLGPSGATFTKLPSARDVERSGQQMPKLPAAGSMHIYRHVAAGLQPATNYTVLFAVRSADILVQTITVISGVLTPDTQPPSFSSVGPISGSMVDLSSFRLQLPVQTSERSTVSYAVFRSLPCILDEPTIPEILRGSRLPAGRCTCTNPVDCAPVAAGNVSFLSVQSDTLTIQGLAPGNPFEALRTATPEQLTCGAAVISEYASRNHTIYLVAQDDLPTYQNYSQTCRAPVVDPSTPAGLCDSYAQAPCSATAPAVEPNNVQLRPYAEVNVGVSAPQPAPSYRPVVSHFQLPDNLTTSFTLVALAASDSQARTITFDFRLSRPGLVYYRLVQDIDKVVFEGVAPVYDTTQTYSVTLSKTCAGQTLGQSGYGFWYWAVDIYGRQGKKMVDSVNFASTGR